MSSGIVVDMGNIFTHITPINNGFPFLNKTETISVGGVELERTLKRLITNDNLLSTKKKIKNPEVFQENIIPYLSDLMPRAAICLNKPMADLLKDPNELLKIKNDSDYSKIDFYKNVPDFYLTFVSRIHLGEKMFGDYQNNDVNIAYSFMQVLMRVSNEDRKKLCQNVVLCGGISMLLGVQKRFTEEIEDLFDAPEFKLLQPIKSYFRVHKVIFPRNCLNWIGGSILSNFEKLNLNHLTLTKEEMDSENAANESPLRKIFSYFK